MIAPLGTPSLLLAGRVRSWNSGSALTGGSALAPIIHDSTVHGIYHLPAGGVLQNRVDVCPQKSLMAQTSPLPPNMTR